MNRIRVKNLIRFILMLSSLSLLCGCALVLEYPITSASVGVWGTTGKGPTDHAVSYALNEDCETLRAINAEAICKKIEPAAQAEVLDKSFNSNLTQKIDSTAPPRQEIAHQVMVQKASKNKAQKKRSKRSSNRSKSR